MTTHDNGAEHASDSAAESTEPPDWHTLDLGNPDHLKLALITIEERGRDHANESRKGLTSVAKLAQDCCNVANMAFGEANIARKSAERVEAKQASDGKLLVKMAKTMGIESPDSDAPPPMRQRFDSLQSEIDLAELAAAEARSAAKLAQERADAATEEAAAAKVEATGALEAAGDAKVLNAEAVTSLKAIAKGVAAGVAALTVIGTSIYGLLQFIQEVSGK